MPLGANSSSRAIVVIISGAFFLWVKSVKILTCTKAFKDAGSKFS